MATTNAQLNISTDTFVYRGSTFTYHVIADDERLNVWVEARVFARALGYSNVYKPLFNHVSKLSKRYFHEFGMTNHSRYKMTRMLLFIDEVGTYDLIKLSKLPNAMDFLECVYLSVFPKSTAIPRLDAYRERVEREKRAMAEEAERERRDFLDRSEEVEREKRMIAEACEREKREMAEEAKRERRELLDRWDAAERERRAMAEEAERERRELLRRSEAAELENRVLIRRSNEERERHRAEEERSRSRLEEMSPHVVVPLENEKLRPHLVVLAKDEGAVNADGSLGCSGERYPLHAIRGQRGYVEKEAEKILRERYPRGRVLCSLPDPNPVARLNLLVEEDRIRKKGNEVSASSVSVFREKRDGSFLRPTGLAFPVRRRP